VSCGEEQPPFAPPGRAETRSVCGWAAGDLVQPRLELEARGGERRPAVIGNGAAHRAVAAHHLRLGVAAALDGALDRTHAPYLLFQSLLGMTVGLEHRQRCLAQEVKLAQLVRHPGQGPCHCPPDRGLPVADHADHRHIDRFGHFVQQRREIVGRARQQAARQRHLT